MKPKILIIGSTGYLGTMLLKFCHKENIKIFGITGYNNKKKLLSQKHKYNIRYSYSLNNKDEKIDFLNFLNNHKIDLVYFLDFGSKSLKYADLFLKNNSNSLIAIANKEMLIAGGSLLINRIHKTKNKLIPLDSEHFSLINSNFNNENINKIFITASGGPFYFNKKINLKYVTKKQVLSHPKWKMGVNNTIDSSNFINKILEIYELSIIFNIDISKIDFLMSKEAYVHSVILFKNQKTVLNCFDNNMIIALSYPLTFYYKFDLNVNNNNYLHLNNLKLEKFNDRRFKINQFYRRFKVLNHKEIIQFMILNNIAQSKYLKGNLKYNEIYDFIFRNITKIKTNHKFSSFDSILRYIDLHNAKFTKN